MIDEDSGTRFMTNLWVLKPLTECSVIDVFVAPSLRINSSF